MAQQRDETVAKARDAVLDRLADDSFKLPLEKKADTFTAREAIKVRFIDMVNEFVEKAFEDIGLGNLDLVLEAASQIVGKDKIKYMANTVAPRMADAAKPMLQLKTSFRNKVKSFCNFHHTAVPRNATVIQQGLTAYYNAGVAGNNNKVDFTVSDMTDRMIHLHMKLGIPLYMMNDVYKLRENYEIVLSRTGSDPCMGIHLINKVKTFNGLKNGKNYSLRDTWLKLPSPIPPVEIEPDEMSNAEKATVEYLEELLAKAVESGIVSYATTGEEEPFNGYGANPDLSNEIIQINGLQIGGNHDAVTNLHVDEIRQVIQKIAEDESQTEENRLKQLQAMRKNSVLRDLRYGYFIQSYANALRKDKVLPTGGESPVEKDRIAEEYLSVRHKLCAWMISMYPDCLVLVEKNLEAFTYLHEKEQKLQEMIENKNRLYKLAEQLTFPWIAGKVRIDVMTFEIENKNGTVVNLFDNNPDEFNAKELKYWEAAMLMQYEEQKKHFSPAVNQLIEETIQKYPANFRTLRDTKVLADVEGNLTGMISHWKEVLTDIRSDVNMNIQRRDTIINIYDKLIKTADGVKQAYDLWKQTSGTNDSAVIPTVDSAAKPAEAQHTDAISSAEPYPREFVDKFAAMPHEAKVTMLKQIPEERRMVLIAQLPADQIAMIMTEL